MIVMVDVHTQITTRLGGVRLIVLAVAMESESV